MPMSASAMREVEEVDNDSKSEITSAHPLIIDKRKKLFIYTVGRGNPPHEGHMATITMAIILAMQNGGIALILLGDGSKDTKGTIENPLEFDLKKEIIEQHIPHEYKSYYAIRQKSVSPIGDIEKFIEEKKNKGDSRIPFVVHLTADKEGKGNEKSDRKKLEFINEGLEKKGFETDSYVIEPTEMGGEEMSATSIRKFAVNKTREEFIDKYRGFYGEAMAGTVYDIIIGSIQNSTGKLLSKYRKVTQEQEETPRSTKKARSGGGTRNKKRKRKGITKKRKPYKSISK
jgi:hypothetical protein